eukprot:Skav226447  [mRNA]  locus=scaffold2660:481300:482643:- [translate_table: standard]
MHKIKGLMDKHDIPCFLCEPEPGKDIVEVTKEPAAECFDMFGHVSPVLQPNSYSTWAVYGIVGVLASNRPLLEWSAQMDGLNNAKVMVAFCFDDYGEQTGVGFETYDELQYAHEKKIKIIPVKLGEDYPPHPPGRAGQQQNARILKEAGQR